MKQWITLLAATAILCSCSKEALQEESLQQNIAPTAAIRSNEQGTFVSAWEQYSDWTKRDSADISIFSRVRPLPQYTSEVANSGLVLTFTKTNKAVVNYEQYQEPQFLDHTIAGINVRVREGFYFLYDKPAIEKITISYNSPLTSGNIPLITNDLSLNDFQFQYVVMSGEFLAQNGLNEQSIRRLSYREIMNLLAQ